MLSVWYLHQAARSFKINEELDPPPVKKVPTLYFKNKENKLYCWAVLELTSIYLLGPGDGL